jgi:hypothetical protein
MSHLSHNSTSLLLSAKMRVVCIFPFTHDHFQHFIKRKKIWEIVKIVKYIVIMEPRRLDEWMWVGWVPKATLALWLSSDLVSPHLLQSTSSPKLHMEYSILHSGTAAWFPRSLDNKGNYESVNHEEWQRKQLWTTEIIPQHPHCDSWENLHYFLVFNFVAGISFQTGLISYFFRFVMN